MSNKVQSSERIKLAEEDDTLITNEEEVAMGLNDFFSNVVVNLKIPKFENSYPLSENVDHPLNAIIRYRKYPSVIAIVSEFTKECFSFNTITLEDALKEISMLYSSKAIQATDIPVKVRKDNSNLIAEKICAYFNESISKENFLNCLELANITLGFKKGARTSKNNYGRVSILPIFSKIFDKLLQKQVLVLFNNILSIKVSVRFLKRECHAKLLINDA